MPLPRTGAGGSADGGCSYHMRATFTAGDQNFADAQVLDTAAEGVPVGSLTVEAFSGTIEIVSNELKLTSVGALAWSDLGLSDEDAVTKALGPALFCSLQRPNLQKSLLSWHDGPLLPTAENLTEYSVRFAVGGAINVYTDTGWGDATTIATGLAASTWYEFALVLGGYDSNGVPWYDGAAGTYTYGCSVYVKGGVFTTWTLLWSFPAGVNNVYAQIQQYEAAGVISLFKNLRTPDRDYSAVLQPTCHSLFGAANGTSLDAITPEVGGAWTEYAGAWQIQGNRAIPPAVAKSDAAVESGISDVMIDVIVDDGSLNSTAGIALRLTDATNLWIAGIKNNANLLRIAEVVADVFTERANAAVVINPNTDYDVRAIAYGQTIDAFVDGGNKCSYGSASHNENATKHGLYGNSANDSFDNFAVYPRTAAVFDDELNACA